MSRKAKPAVNEAHTAPLPVASVLRAEATPPVVVVSKSGLMHRTAMDRLRGIGGDRLLTPGDLTPDNRWGSGKFSSEQIRGLILQGIAGGASLHSVLHDLEAQHGKMPSPFTVYGWRKSLPDFGAQYRDAQACRGELFAEAAAEAAIMADEETASADKIRVQAFQWQASRLAKDTFGDHKTLDVQHTVKDMSEAEVDRRLQELLRDPELRAALPAGAILDAEIVPPTTTPQA